MFDYTITAEDEFRAWLDSVAPSLEGLPITKPELSLDERVALKEKLIKRKIESRMRYQRKKMQRLADSQLSMETLDCLIQKQLEI